MKPVVFFVDEDSAAFEAWMAELEFRGVPSERIGTADAAFDRLGGIAPAQVGLVIIDVMLAVTDATNEQFSKERTDGYLETGLCLLRDLVQANSRVFPSAAVLLTNTITSTTLKAAKQLSAEFTVPLWQKADISSPLEFGDRVGRELERVGAIMGSSED